MATVALERSFLSVAKILRAADPKKELARELIRFLTIHLKGLSIHWNSKAFQAGLENPDLPQALLEKLEDLLGVAESLGWTLPKTLTESLDGVIEDIETFDPVFSDSLEAARGSRRVLAALVKKRLGV